MKLETWDELEEGNPIFCWACGKQVLSIDEISQRICSTCKNTKKLHTEEDVFFCWACGKKLAGMGEVAQGICHSCRSAILRKIK